MVEVVNPNYVYEPVRVEINSKGKFRARKVNLIQTSQVIQVPYPLKMRPLALFRYFQVREQWRMTDFLFNPMVTKFSAICIEHMYFTSSVKNNALFLFLGLNDGFAACTDYDPAKNYE